MTTAPHPRTRESRSGSGRPKWKLTTGGANAASTSAASAENGARPGPAGASEATPSSAKYGAKAARQRASASASGAGGVWAKKFTLYGTPASRRRDSSARRASGLSIAAGRDPSAPACPTAIASALPCTPAMGAWIRGYRVPNRAARSTMVPSCPLH
nr:hypothetical protein [Propioniciclava sp. MC1595]